MLAPARTDPGFGPGLLRSQVRANLSYLTHLAQQYPAVDLRTFDLPHIFRLIVTDRGAHLTFYGEHAPRAALALPVPAARRCTVRGGPGPVRTHLGHRGTAPLNRPGRSVNRPALDPAQTHFPFSVPQARHRLDQFGYRVTNGQGGSTVL